MQHELLLNPLTTGLQRANQPSQYVDFCDVYVFLQKGPFSFSHLFFLSWEIKEKTRQRVINEVHQDT